MEHVIDMPTALIVDDEPAVARALSKLLRRRGYRCDTTSEVEEVGRLVTERAYDLLVSDLRMPEKDGFEVVADVVARRPETTTVILTGYADADSEARAKEVGVDAFMSKQADEDEIERCLEVALLNKTIRLASEPY